MLVVIAYDIPDDGRRSRLARLLSSYGERVQLSVFEVHLDTAQLVALKDKVRKLIELHHDSVRFYKMGKAYPERIAIEGLGTVTPSPRFLIA